MAMAALGRFFGWLGWKFWAAVLLALFVWRLMARTISAETQAATLQAANAAWQKSWKDAQDAKSHADDALADAELNGDVDQRLRDHKWIRGDDDR